MKTDMILTLQDEQGNVIGYTTDSKTGIEVSSKDPKYVKFLQEEDAKKTFVKLDLLRFKRNTLLKESDWVMFSDVNVSNKEAWLTYRQALRDLPQNFEDPSEVIWPEKPE